MKRILSVLSILLCAVLLALPAAADVIWEPPVDPPVEPPVEPETEPDETVPLVMETEETAAAPKAETDAREGGSSVEATAERISPVVVALVVSLVVIALGLLVWLIFRGRTAPKGENIR